MLKYERPYPYLLWKLKTEEGMKSGNRLQNVKILDTVIMRNAHAVGRGKESSTVSIDWFFYSEKQRSVLKRSAHNASLSSFHNFFIKEQKKEEDWDKAA